MNRPSWVPLRLGFVLIAVHRKSFWICKSLAVYCRIFFSFFKCTIYFFTFGFVPPLGKRILDRCKWEFCIEVSPSVFGYQTDCTVHYIDASHLFYSVFSEQGLHFGGYMSNISVLWCWTSLCFVFIHENIIFAQCLYVNVNLYCLVFLLRVWECVWESVSLCACMRTPVVVFLLTGHICCRKKKHSCCLVTCLWLHIIYYIFLFASPNFHQIWHSFFS